VTEDPQLAAALERAARHLGPKPRAALVRELILLGADAAEEEAWRRPARVRLAMMAINREGLDWDLLERIEQEAWGTPPDDE
jgi:hypothetical protein